jgi:DNA invertase Pin-like site-specific DNA recombinase
MKDVKAKRKGEKTYKKFAEAEQIKVVQEIQNKLISPSAAIRKYGFSQRTLYNWINK